MNADSTVEGERSCDVYDTVVVESKEQKTCHDTTIKTDCLQSASVSMEDDGNTTSELPKSVKKELEVLPL